MRINAKFLCLPASLVLIVASHTIKAELPAEDQTPAQWPKHARYWPEDPPHRRRDLEALQQHVRRGDQKVGVMKMSSDPGEKFYMEYWQYEEKSVVEERNLRARDDEEASIMTNISTVVDFKMPFALHTEREEDMQDLKVRAAVGRSAAALAALEKRQFTCPVGTNACSSIGYPNSCCPTAEDCFQIQDTGLGPVGCCPRGRTCSGIITSCGFPNSACPSSLGGGCCLPNFICQGVGCVINVVTTVLITQTFPSRSSTTTSTSIITSSSIPLPLPTSTTTTAVSLTCRSDTNPCPTSLGGGCCHTDRVCASNGLCALPAGSSTSASVSTQIPSPTTTVAGGPPIRPTSQTTTGPILTTDCPVYFYACSAVYGGGCCQTGRDCAVTSCPPTAYTTIITGSQTIVVPVGPAATTAGPPTGVCASGWSTCAASVGGNCCPSGWACGTASCTAAGASSTSVEQKQSPNSGNLLKGFGSLAVVMGVLTAFIAII